MRERTITQPNVARTLRWSFALIAFVLAAVVAVVISFEPLDLLHGTTILIVSSLALAVIAAISTSRLRSSERGVLISMLLGGGVSIVIGVVHIIIGAGMEEEQGLWIDAVPWPASFTTVGGALISFAGILWSLERQQQVAERNNRLAAIRESVAETEILLRNVKELSEKSLSILKRTVEPFGEGLRAHRSGLLALLTPVDVTEDSSRNPRFKTATELNKALDENAGDPSKRLKILVLNRWIDECCEQLVLQSRDWVDDYSELRPRLVTAEERSPINLLPFIDDLELMHALVEIAKDAYDEATPREQRSKCRAAVMHFSMVVAGLASWPWASLDVEEAYSSTVGRASQANNGHAGLAVSGDGSICIRRSDDSEAMQFDTRLKPGNYSKRSSPNLHGAKAEGSESGPEISDCVFLYREGEKGEYRPTRWIPTRINRQASVQTSASFELVDVESKEKESVESVKVDWGMTSHLVAWVGQTGDGENVALALMRLPQSTPKIDQTPEPMDQTPEPMKVLGQTPDRIAELLVTERHREDHLRYSSALVVTPGPDLTPEPDMQHLRLDWHWHHAFIPPTAPESGPRIPHESAIQVFIRALISPGIRRWLLDKAKSRHETCKSENEPPEVGDFWTGLRDTSDQENVPSDGSGPMKQMLLPERLDPSPRTSVSSRVDDLFVWDALPSAAPMQAAGSRWGWDDVPDDELDAWRTLDRPAPMMQATKLQWGSNDESDRQ